MWMVLSVFFLALFAFVAVCAAVAAAATCVYDDDVVVVVLFFICYFSLFDSHFWFPFGSGLWNYTFRLTFTCGDMHWKQQRGLTGLTKVYVRVWNIFDKNNNQFVEIEFLFFCFFPNEITNYLDQCSRSFGLEFRNSFKSKQHSLPGIVFLCCNVRMRISSVRSCVYERCES